MQNPEIVVLGFHTTYEKKGNGEYKSVDWVTFSPARAVNTVRNIERVSALKPDYERLGNDEDGVKRQFVDARWSAIEPAWEAWKKGQEIPVNGMPLAAWAGIDKGRVDILKAVGIRTVEDVRDMSDGQMEKIRLPNLRQLKQQAKLYLDGQSAAAAIERETEKDLLIAELSARIDALGLGVPGSENSGKPQTEKRGPGRPRIERPVTTEEFDAA